MPNDSGKKLPRKNYTLRLNSDVIKKATVRAAIEDTKISDVVEEYLTKYADGVDIYLKKQKG